MKYALNNGQRTEARPGLSGECPICNRPMVARCGEINIWHWAHKGKRICDTYWENETEWHREWKNRFPHSWQEAVLEDSNTREKHIADVRTEDGFVIEFQYSNINAEERESRERFYRRMVWVINGVRRKTDYKRFYDGLKGFNSTKQRGIFFVSIPDECFPLSWVDRSVPVFFDFEGTLESDPRVTNNVVWGLLPGRQLGNAITLCVSKDQFVDFATKGILFEKLSEINKFSKT